MAAAILAFILAFFFSFIGSIPPGAINLSIIQLGLEHRMNVAWRFAIAAAIVEYPYAWLAVKFAEWITSSPLLLDNLQLLTAIVMTLLGIISLWPSNKPSRLREQFNKSGFRRGIVLSIFNPLAVPYWLGITAYLKSQKWIYLSDAWELQAYLAGVVLGALAILVAMAYLAKRIAAQFQQSIWLRKVPGITLVILGLYAFIQYLL
jgi:threonine/homoserine/homoserine lactone efflux protein